MLKFVFLIAFLTITSSPLSQGKINRNIEIKKRWNLYFQGTENIIKFIDKEENAVCYIFRQSLSVRSGSGISCIPRSQKKDQ